MQITNSSNVEKECNQKNSILSSVLFRVFRENDTGSDNPELVSVVTASE